VNEENGASGALTSEKELRADPVVTIDVAVSDEDVIKFDEAGYRLRFAHEKGSFKELSDEVYESLSLRSKGAYDAIKELAAQDVRIKDDPDRVTGIEFIRGAIIAASAGERVNGTKVKRGLSHYWSHLGKIGQRQAQGFRIAHDEDIVDCKAEVADGKRVLRMPDGNVESVLMVCDKERRDGIIRKQTEIRNSLGEKVSEAAAEQAIRETGVEAKPY
jgi:hypothetical protein